MSPKLYRFWMGTLAVSLACSAAGGLREREEDITRRSEAKREAEEGNASSAQNDDIAHAAFGSGTYPSAGSSSSGGFMSDFWGWLVMAPFAYRVNDPSAALDDEHGEWATEKRSLFPHHERGQATVPYARFDYNFQWADKVDAHDARIEAGYKFFAFHARFTHYKDTLGDTLDVNQYYGMLRYGGLRPDTLPGSFEISAGGGVVHHSGIGDDSSGAFTFGIKYYPVEWAGVEFRPAFYRWDEIFIRDYDASVSLGGRFLQGRAGYRWIWDQGVVDLQSGPYAGLSLSF